MSVIWNGVGLLLNGNNKGQEGQYGVIFRPFWPFLVNSNNYFPFPIPSPCHYRLLSYSYLTVMVTGQRDSMERDEMELQSKRDYLCRMAKLVDGKPMNDQPIDPDLILSFED